MCLLSAGVAKLLLDSTANINTHSNEFKESALTLACYKGHLEMVKYLLNAGTMVNVHVYVYVCCVVLSFCCVVLPCLVFLSISWMVKVMYVHTCTCMCTS